MLYALLAAGAVTTLYPFLVMIAGGMEGPSDQNDNALVPAYLHSDPALFAKYVDDKYAGNVTAIAATRGGPTNPEAVARYRKFVMTLPLDMVVCGFRQPPSGIDSRLNTLYQAWLRRRFGNIEALNRAYIEEDTSFETVLPPVEAFDRIRWRPAPGPKWDDWLVFKSSLPVEFRLPVTTRALYQNFMRGAYHFSFASVPPALASGAHDFDHLDVPAAGPALAAFEASGIPAGLRHDTVEARWLAFLGHPVAGDPVAAAAGVRLPIEADERTTVSEEAPTLRREFAGRNFAFVLRYLTVNGHALWTTLIYCGLAIVTTLCVNGMAAYALSRYPIRASGKILVFLLATMAFPAEVTMIPNFLLLKDLHLLNTYAALILPGAASGFMIFMLKGFFDSLPAEIFEAASIDGAKELTMLRRLALPLSRPVFGYFALTTFMGAYGTFLYAFLVAQDRRMWTVMVFLYQLSGTAPKYVMMAAFTLAALPTLLVFLFAQRTIMRGIVLPSER